MTDPGADDLRRRLAAARDRLAALERDHAAVVAASRDSNADDEHDPEGATIAFERAQIETLAAVTRAEAARLEDAIERVAAGTYGHCEACSRPIGAARLEARPAATRCIDCAT